MQGADLVLFCVKSTDTDAVAGDDGAATSAPTRSCSACRTASRTRRRSPAASRQTVVPAVVYVATAMPEPGTVAALRPRRPGDRRARAPPAPGDAAASARLQALVDLFATAKVPVRISADVMAELWSKLMVNCAYNAISGLAQLPYGRLAALPSVRELQHAVVRRGRRRRPRPTASSCRCRPRSRRWKRIAAAMPAQLSSTAQDMARGKPSEIDHLNGFVARRGRELGVATPANQALHALVKLVESDPHG